MANIPDELTASGSIQKILSDRDTAKLFEEKIENYKKNREKAIKFAEKQIRLDYDVSKDIGVYIHTNFGGDVFGVSFYDKNTKTNGYGQEPVRDIDLRKYGLEEFMAK